MKPSVGLLLLIAAALGMAYALPSVAADRFAKLPHYLSETGLYAAGSNTKIRAENLPFSPQYPLWSDGATKRRWLYLPPGTAIDASNPDAWEFPPGTKLWKEFSHGRPIETRYIVRLVDGSWRYATYVWDADGSEALLAPPEGIPALPLPALPNGRYAVPAEADCRACHEGAAVPVLGVGSLQLSPERDPLAPHAEVARADSVDLRGLVARGLLRNLPTALLSTPPRIAAATPTARAALGYLHGNCGHCHNEAGPLSPLDMTLAQEVRVSSASTAKALQSLVGKPSRYRPPGFDANAQRVVSGSHEASVLAVRMRSRNALIQMPPLGTEISDDQGIALIERWIRHDLNNERSMQND